MAKVKLSAAIGAIAGHTGSLAFWIGPAGTMVVSKPTPRTAQTAAQRASQGAWTAMIRAWATSVTTAEKSAWATFGATYPCTTKCGGTAHLPGFHAFARSARALATIHLPPVTTPPGSWSSSGASSITLAYTPPPTQSLKVTPSSRPSRSQVPVISASGPVHYGRLNTDKHTFILATETAGSHGPWDIAGAWEGKFGPITSGQTISVSVVYYDNTSGARSTPARAQILIP